MRTRPRIILDFAGISPFGWVVRFTLPLLVAAGWRAIQYLIRNPD